MIFESKDQAFNSLKDKGFRYDASMSIKEDKWFIFNKGKNYSLITPKYDSIIGTRWIVRTWH
jgi:hypothetical protein